MVGGGEGGGLRMRLMVGDFLLNVWDIVAFGWGVGGVGRGGGDVQRVLYVYSTLSAMGGIEARWLLSSYVMLHTLLGGG